MAQRPTADFNIDPNVTSGTDLANILNRFQDAIDSGNSGGSRPAYLAAGGLWVREGDPMRLYLYDGTTDRELYNTTDGIVGALEDGTIDGQITTWNASSGEWTPEGGVVVDANGNVGIGTDNPSGMGPLSKLYVKGAVVFDEVVSASEASLPAIQQGSHNGTGQDLMIAARSSNGALRFFTGNTGSDGNIGDSSNVERMRIDSNGNVGIGVTPQERLHLESGNVLLKSEYNSSGVTESKIFFQTRGGGNWRNSYIRAESSNLVFGTGGTGSDYTNAAPRMTIAADGRVDITGSLYVNGTPKIGTKELIETLSTLREATKDENTLEGLRDAIGDAIGGLIQKFEAMQAEAKEKLEEAYNQTGTQEITPDKGTKDDKPEVGTMDD